MIFKDGFDFCFDESACATCGGACCTGESGFIWINESEIKELSKLLKISIAELKEQYLFRLDGRYSIKEKEYKNGVACVFFDEINKNCGIYSARPAQCRSFPFWTRYTSGNLGGNLEGNLAELFAHCSGVKKAKF